MGKFYKCFEVKPCKKAKKINFCKPRKVEVIEVVTYCDPYVIYLDC